MHSFLLLFLCLYTFAKDVNSQLQPNISTSAQPKTNIIMVSSGGSANGSSLALVIDATASMSSTIDLVKSVSKNIWSRIAQETKIADYVLVTFQDPDSQSQKFTNDAEFLNAIQKINVSQGGDCPEPSMSATMKAIRSVQVGSPIFVFTDGSAKDYKLEGNVIQMANAKHCQIFFILTGHCNSTTDPLKYKTFQEDPSFKVYGRIASATSGMVFKVKKGDKLDSNTFSQLLTFIARQQNSIPIYSQTYPSPDPTIPQQIKVKIAKDAAFDVLTILVRGNNPQLTLTSATGVPQSPEIPLKINNVLIVKLKGLPPGEYEAVASFTGPGQFRVYAQFKKDVRSVRLIMQLFSDAAGTQKSPIFAGSPLYPFVLANNLPPPGYLTKLYIVDMQGRPFATYNLDPVAGKTGFPVPNPLPIPIRQARQASTDSASQLYSAGEMIVPTTPFRIVIEGYDSQKFKFTRETKSLTYPLANPCMTQPCGLSRCIPNPTSNQNTTTNNQQYYCAEKPPGEPRDVNPFGPNQGPSENTGDSCEDLRTELEKFRNIAEKMEEMCQLENDLKMLKAHPGVCTRRQPVDLFRNPNPSLRSIEDTSSML